MAQCGEEERLTRLGRGGKKVPFNVEGGDALSRSISFLIVIEIQGVGGGGGGGGRT